MKMENTQIRSATPGDMHSIVELNRSMALDTESRALLPSTIASGVRRFFDHPDVGFYVVAGHADRLVGMLCVTREWSDWRNGYFWWLGSVFVVPELRRQGICKAMFQYVRSMAADESSVCGLRLYVDRDNAAAQGAYVNLGLCETRCLLYQELKDSS